MKLYAIGDLHLSFQEEFITDQMENNKLDKPMDCFGPEWVQHYLKIYKNWLKKINKKDIVLIPGDISWATKLEETRYDFAYLKKLPGKKILLKGNHDYWWQSISKVRQVLPDNTYAIQNDSMVINNVMITGTRGWRCPGTVNFTEHDLKVFKREIIRLDMALQAENTYKKIVMFHYMPVNDKHEKNEFIELLQKNNVDICIYGHLHGKESHENRLPDQKWGIKFVLVSADFINFSPVEIKI